MLPEPYRTQTLTNMRTHNCFTLAPDASAAVSWGFGWSASPEGLAYWLELYGKLDRIKTIKTNILVNERNVYPKSKVALK